MRVVDQDGRVFTITDVGYVEDHTVLTIDTMTLIRQLQAQVLAVAATPATP